MLASKHNSGFTLLEIVLYVGLLMIVVVFANSFAVAIIRINASSELTEQARDNAHHTLDIIDKEVRLARSVYTPTSVFGTSPGQLSLETGEQLPTGETTTYVDFYLDDERVYMKREGLGPELIIGENIRVTNFTFTHLTAGSAPDMEAVRVDMSAVYNTGSGGGRTVRFTTTSSLRSY